ncbi:MAG: hypothetical protein COV48_12585 [Elusimicrobia bacterium CG11_big_fil_rev_8_21_14_0_20_64_6]|nr:MAG: hypothetical protein COV48_12585 [Elusimicrobia bacterium CG11_big_fil_rev_8_21_14_0_20_64_6]
MPPSSQFLSAARIEALQAFHSLEPDALTLHLAVDSGGLYPSTMHQLSIAARQDPRMKRLIRDLDRIEAFISSEFVPGSHRMAAVYSCAKRGLFETFTLPQPFKSALTVGEKLDLRPLLAIKNQYHRFVVLLLGPGKARFIELHMGHAIELASMQGDFSGMDGLGAVASRAATLARERRYDRLILGASAELESLLVPILDPALQKDLILEPVLGPDRPVEAVLERVLHNERQARSVRESVLVHRLLDDARAGGAVTGLEAVAAAIQQGFVQRVLMRDGYTKMGRSCPKCGHLSVSNRSCPWCFCATEPVLDLVGELGDKALDAGCELYRIMHDARFDGVCRIGAELKVPVSKPAAPPTARALLGQFKTKRGGPSPLRPR